MSALLCAFNSQIHQEALICTRKPSLILNPLLFFLLVISLFPLGISLDLELLHRIGPGLVWVAVLLSILLSIDRLFQLDYETGVLEQCLIQSMPLSLWVLAKVMAFFIFTVFPLLLLIPLLALMLHFSLYEGVVLFLSLLLGTPVVLFISAIASALSLGIGGRSALLPLLLLPLIIPILIFGAGSVDMVMQGVSAWPLLMILMAMSLIAISLGPFVVAFALKLTDI